MMRAYEFVTNTPLRLDEHRGYLVDDVAMVRISPPLSPPIKVIRAEGMIERCVIVNKTTSGYGFTVTGDNPVYVQDVRNDGPAYASGVRKGDRILKVNGMPVTAGNQQEVLRMISAGSILYLTLLGKPPEPQPMYSAPNLLNEVPLNGSYSPTHENADWRTTRKEYIRKMLEEERQHVEELRAKAENGEKLNNAMDRITALQIQLHNKDPPPPWSQQPAEMDDTDEEENDYTLPNEPNQGPFSNLAELCEHPAHLAVFINYLLAQANPSSLFYYIVTSTFIKAQGTSKEFRRWAFEIFTTFIIPNSPMVIPNSDQSIIQPIDKILATTLDSVTESDIEIFRRVFFPGRQRAVQDINEHLNEFRQKRQLGLGSIFDANQLANLSRGDPAMEAKVGEQMFFKCLENLIGNSVDVDTCELKTQAIVASLATVIRVSVGKPSSSAWEKLLDRCPQFVQRDKTGKSRKPPSNFKTKCQVKGHNFVMSPVNTVHYCYQCNDAIWGMQPWCYFCSNCEVKVHGQCTSTLGDACYPATQSTKKVLPKSKRSGIMRNDEEDETRPEPHVKSASSDSGIGPEYSHDRVNVNRSQSMKTNLSKLPAFQESNQAQHARDRATPSWSNDLPPADEEDEVRRPVSLDGRTQATSLDGSRLEVRRTKVLDDQSSCSSASLADSEVRRMVDRLAISDGDSDMEVETEIPKLEQLLGWDVVKHIKPKEKRRQETINELFHTEKTHVRNLKILLKVFYRPMLERGVVTPDVLRLLFANLEELIDVHSIINKRMKEAVEQYKRDPNLNGLYGSIGFLMESMFTGDQGRRLMEVTSSFCQHQQHALEILRNKIDTKKDKEDNLLRFLNEAESHPICRKLQLKDMIPVEMQRLVKYPMLLEGVAKYTPEPSEEQDGLLRAVAAAKRTLTAVNTAKRNAENLRRLEELQRRMDTTPFDKEFGGHDYAFLNLTKYRLVHDGPLTCRFNRGKMAELHVILLENMLVLLTRYNEGNKLLLKTLEPSKETKWSPILPLHPLMPKEKANDKRAFFLVYNSQYGAQIFELVAATATERKTWFKLMSDQIEIDKKHHKQGIEHPNFDMGSSSNVDSDGMAKVHVLTHPRLVNACEITVQQPTILEHAHPVLTPTERLKRSDEVIFQALLTKHNILSQFLPGDKKGKPEELEKLTELLGGLSVADLKQRDSKELAMSAIVHGNRLLDSINNGMNAHKEADDATPGGSVLMLDDSERHLPSVPCYKLTAIAAPLMNHLKALMQVVQDQQNELNSVKQQLYHYKELAESCPRDRSVSEETLTECSMETPERKLITKRQRAPSIQPLT